MKKLIQIITLLFLFVLNLESQNLISNPGFDSITRCPNTFFDTKMAPPWSFIGPTSGSDRPIPPLLCSPCVTDFPNNVPYVTGDFQHARSKENYMQILVYGDGSNWGNRYLQTKLKEKMKRRKEYYARVFVNPVVRSGAEAVFSNNIGMAFLDEPHDTTYIRLSGSPVPPDIDNQIGIISDTANWTKIGGCYIADGKEEHLVIGGLRSDEDVNISEEDPRLGPNFSYLLIDDVLVEEFNPLPDSITFCDGISESYDVSFYDATIKWNGSINDTKFTLDKSGTYFVEATIDGCTLKDEIVVIVTESEGNSWPDTTICHDEFVVLEAPIFGDYFWSTGETSQSISVSQSGTYEVEIMNDCGEYSYSTNVESQFCDCKVYIPNAFSPNNDGVNDFFIPYFSCDFDYKINQFSVFDRWGNQLYSSKNEKDFLSWNGKAKESPLDNGIYAWFLEYEVIRNGISEVRIEKGDVTIIR